MKKVFNITGMSCAACSTRVEKRVSALEGMESVQVNLLKNTMSVTFDPEILTEEEIVKAVIDAGYGVGDDKKQ